MDGMTHIPAFDILSMNVGDLMELLERTYTIEGYVSGNEENGTAEAYVDCGIYDNPIDAVIVARTLNKLVVKGELKAQDGRPVERLKVYEDYLGPDQIEIWSSLLDVPDDEE